MEEMEKQYEIRVMGRVQGVGFRYAAQSRARELGLKGWVENRSDGSVFMVVRGSPRSCMLFINWCHQGPAYGWVEKTEVEESALSPETHFRIRR